MPESYLKMTPAEKNKAVLSYLNKYYQKDFVKFY